MISVSIINLVGELSFDDGVPAPVLQPAVQIDCCCGCCGSCCCCCARDRLNINLANESNFALTRGERSLCSRSGSDWSELIERPLVCSLIYMSVVYFVLICKK